ncbi:hypothetical protein FAZ69_30170 [Trinickia terrae]|uniref:Uncharacterized protein n=1 Tax=Trinickia terrae TaxID=2571161 RepID=A0A4U1HJG5_9BURK|nr:hypothetical protein FAZ69_30170 [Trinickia terrae]
MACLNLSGVVVGIAPRATMRVAPDGPKKPFGFESRFFCQVLRQAGVPFTSSNFSDRKTRWVDFGKAVSGIG